MLKACVILHHIIASSSSMTRLLERVPENVSTTLSSMTYQVDWATRQPCVWHFAAVAEENHWKELFWFADEWGKELKRRTESGWWEEQGGKKGHGQPELRPEQLPLSVHLLFLHQLGHLEVVRLQTSHSEHNQVFWRGNRKSTGGWGTFSWGAGVA